jgi:hypothetical protein
LGDFFSFLFDAPSTFRHISVQHLLPFCAIFFLTNKISCEILLTAFILPLYSSWRFLEPGPVDTGLLCPPLITVQAMDEDGHRLIR